jgi:signal transduction histidine kinase
MSKSFRLLIADDDDGDRRHLRRLLRNCGIACEIDEVLGLAEAEAACSAQAYDCAIIDYRMPGGNGLRAIVAIRGLFPHLPIIMVTGQGDELIATEAIKLGAADYIPKLQLSSGYLAHVIRSALRKAELERIVADQREELERFGHVLAHDLKTPIHHLQHIVRFIDQDISTGDADALALHRKMLLATAKRMEDLINALQNYSMSNRPIDLSRLELDHALDGSLSNLAGEIAERDAVISRIRLPAVRGNLPLLTQLFQNLIGNCLKYSGEVRPEISVSAEDQGDRVFIAISDNGIGVPVQQRQAIFQPFQRLHRQAEIEGTGLGLAICRKIVERHGGTIWCEASPAGGSIFRFSLAAGMSASSMLQEF